MAKCFPELTDELIDFIRRQKIFFVASAPGDGGYANLSPKGCPTLAALDRSTLAYADYPGSGNHTAEHVRDNGRLTIMFCSFDDKPLVLRVYGKGEVVPAASRRGTDLLAAIGLAPDPWIRQVILLRVEKAVTSCGYGVPLFEYRGDRPTLLEWCRRRHADGTLAKYMGRAASPQPEPRQEAKEPGYA